MLSPGSADRLERVGQLVDVETATPASSATRLSVVVVGDERAAASARPARRACRPPRATAGKSRSSSSHADAPGCAAAAGARRSRGWPRLRRTASAESAICCSSADDELRGTISGAVQEAGRADVGDTPVDDAPRCRGPRRRCARRAPAEPSSPAAVARATAPPTQVAQQARHAPRTTAAAPRSTAPSAVPEREPGQQAPHGAAGRPQQRPSAAPHPATTSTATAAAAATAPSAAPASEPSPTEGASASRGGGRRTAITTDAGQISAVPISPAALFTRLAHRGDALDRQRQRTVGRLLLGHDRPTLKPSCRGLLAAAPRARSPPAPRR